MAKQNSLNKESQNFTLDPGASGGDPFVQFDINATGEFRIGVDNTDDSFKISQGSSLGVNDTFIMTENGERTMPLQSSAIGNLRFQDSSITGNGAVYTLGSGNVLTDIYDQNDDMSSTGVFTAPVTGIYLLVINLRPGHVGIQTSPAMTQGYLSLITTNRTYRYSVNPFAMLAQGPGPQGSGTSFIITTIADMSAGHTATVTLQVIGGPLNNINIFGINESIERLIASISGTLLA